MKAVCPSDALSKSWMVLPLRGICVACFIYGCFGLLANISIPGGLLGMPSRFGQRSSHLFVRDLLGFERGEIF